MSADVDLAFDAFKIHMPLIEAAVGSNEATTRLRAIDTILYDVLKWDKRHTEHEKYCREEGYADYVFFQRSAICLVLEAKKQGATFLLPDKEYPERPVSLSFISNESKDADKAIRQAQGYAAELGSRYMAVSNGHQWIMCLTFVQGQPLADRSAFVFSSPDKIKSRFRQFWECFSPSAVWQNEPSNALLDSRQAEAPNKLSYYIDNYPAPADRNVIANDIDTVLSVVLEQVKNNEREMEFFEECYILPESNVSLLELTREFVEQRSTADRQLETSATDSNSLSSLIQGYAPERPIVILGSIGHGKTTFLRYFREISAPTLLKKYIQLDVDFLDRPSNPLEIEGFIFDEVEQQLLAKRIDIKDDSVVRSALREDLQRFPNTSEGKRYEKGSEGYKDAELAFLASLRHNRHRYFQKLMWHLKYGQRKSVALFLDNLDRRSDELQEEAFLRASAIAREWAALVFISLRPETFERSKDAGVLDSIAPRILHVSPPQSGPLIRRRMRYAANIARGERKIATVSSREFSMELPRAAKFFECADKSFQRKKLSAIFESAANGNIREMLFLLGSAFTSQHLNTGKIIAAWEEDGYELAQHELLRAILYRNSMHYDPSRCPFINIFDIQKANPRHHFTVFLLLHLLASVNPNHPSHGFVKLDRIVQSVCQMGFTHENVMNAVKRLMEASYCEPRSNEFDSKELASELRITAIGRFHATTLINTFVYMDAMAVDTPILSSNVRRKISDCFALNDRLDRCRIFLDYLSECVGDVGDSKLESNWRETKELVDADIELIAEKDEKRRIGS